MNATFQLDGCHTLHIADRHPELPPGTKAVGLTVTHEPLVNIWSGTASSSKPIFPAPEPTLSEAQSREPHRVFYGPHPCQVCGNLIVKEGVRGKDGGAEFDVPDGPIYPNTAWRPHVHREYDEKLRRTQTVISFALQASAARAIASMILSAATEARG